MDLALRTLREGRPAAEGPAPLLVLRDDLAVVGGPALVRQAVAELAAAIGSGRAQAAALTIIALERPAAHYWQLCSLSSLVHLTVLDCFSDAYAWGSILGSDGGSSSGASQSGSVPLPGILASPDGLQQLQQCLCSGAATATAGLQQCLVIDCVSPLIDRFGAASVARLLHSLQAAPATSSLLCGLHTDLHPAADLAAVEQLAAGTLQLAPASELERSVCRATHGSASDPQGRLTLRLKRRAGRVRAQAHLYCIGADGGVALLEPPADLLNPQAAAEKAVAAASAGSGNGGPEAASAQLAQQLAGGMKMGLSAAELEAKQRVQLPFEHQGQGAAYRTGDFRDYLPPEAGGRAGGAPPAAASNGAAAAAGGQHQPHQQGQQQQQQLGHILYVRDSGSEHDSDEDPDDDLDI